MLLNQPVDAHSCFQFYYLDRSKILDGFKKFLAIAKAWPTVLDALGQCNYEPGLRKSGIDYTRQLNPPFGSPDRVWVKCGAT